MCLIIDTCAWHKVFGSKDSDFMPVKDWLYDKNGKMIIGGSTYQVELETLKKYLGVIAELSRQRKVVKINDNDVDKTEQKIKKIINSGDFDDPHIVALVEESGCRVVCTLDSRSDKYLRDNSLYKKSKRPSIYRSAKHAHLLCDKNIVTICR